MQNHSTSSFWSAKSRWVHFLLDAAVAEDCLDQLDEAILFDRNGDMNNGPVTFGPNDHPSRPPSLESLRLFMQQ